MTDLYSTVSYQDTNCINDIKDELTILKNALSQTPYSTPYGALYAPSDGDALTKVQQVVHTVQQLQPTLCLLVGIGGSNMGTLAVLQALGISNTSSLRFLCADTIDERYTDELLEQFRSELSAGNRVILCIVTKSGTTAETIINGALFLEILKQYHPDDYYRYVVAITDSGSPLWQVAQQEGYELLEIPCEVGGRYSVFTPVGLFPLMLLGVDIKAFCAGARKKLARCLTLSLETNEAAQSALSLYAHYQQGYTIHNLFIFSPSLVHGANWYKQLIGESLGKKHTKEGALVEVGFTPVVSLGTTDLHSVAQLYLSGPRTIITSFIVFDDESHELKVPQNSLSTIIPGMPGRSLTFVKSAIIEGTVAAYNKEERPSLVTHLEQSSSSLGAFFVTKMVETILLGRLWNINPFDQPGVELYKQETRSILRYAAS